MLVFSLVYSFHCQLDNIPLKGKVTKKSKKSRLLCYRHGAGATAASAGPLAEPGRPDSPVALPGLRADPV